uniref:ERD4-related membrane protein n=1 Tax=Auxenochlorella protothecoides TaxID=3075 RepID=A0A1D2A6U9_AUXPR
MNDTLGPPPPAPGYKITLGTDPDTNACQNSTSPICFNTAVSGQNIITGLWFNAIIGIVMLGLFIAWRGTFSFYQARLDSPHVTRKPPRMKLTGHHRIWSWLVPVFTISDEELVRSAGLDALVATRIIGFGVTLFAPMTVLAVAVLLPINYGERYYASQAKADAVSDTFTSVFIQLTISNVHPRSSLMWVHFTLVYVFCAWTCWLTVEYYKEYIAIRQAYMVQATEMHEDEPGASACRNESEGTEISLTPAAWPGAKRGASPDPEPVARGFSLGSALTNRLQLPRRTATGSQLSGAAMPAPSRSRLGLADGASACPAQELELVEGAGQRAGGALAGIKSPRALADALLAGSGRVRRALAPPARAWGEDEDRVLLHGFRGATSSAQSEPGGVGAAVGLSGVEGARGAVEGAGEDGGGGMGPGPHDGEGELSLRQRFGSPRAGGAGPRDGQAIDGDRGEEAHADLLAIDGGGAALSLIPARMPRSGSVLSLGSGSGPGTPLCSSQHTSRRPRHARSGSHAAAVAAALGGRRGSNARDAIRVIRHVRARSGASGDSGGAGMGATDDALAAFVPGAAPPPGPESEPSRTPSADAEAAPLSPPSVDAGRGAGDDDGDENGSDDALAGVRAWWLPHGGAAPARPRRGPSPRLHRDDGTAAAGQANASLFTVLVTDAPVEKLHLLRLGVFDFARGAPAAAGAAQVAVVPGVPAYTAAQDDFALALDEVENGLWTGSSPSTPEPEEAAERRRWRVARWLRQLLRRDQSYTDWRRDVQWAMFNKRVRVATELFTELFGDDFDAIIPIYPTKPVDDVIHRWDGQQAALERLQYRLKKGGLKPHKLDKLRASIAKAQRRLSKLQRKAAERREEVLSDLPSTCFFATFRSQEAAAIAVQTNLNPIMQRLFRVEPAPRPEDINWPSLQRSWWQRTLRPLWALPGIILIMLVPIGAFTGAFAQLTIALCGNPAAGTASAGSDLWICGETGFPALLRNLITSLGPSILLSIYNMVILPVIIYYLAQVEGQAVSLSALDRRCADLFFAWDIFNVFLGAMLGGTILGELRTFLTEPGRIWSALGSAIPAASNFFINYISYRAFVMAFFRLFYPSQAVVTSIGRLIRLIPASKTERDKALELPNRNCRFGRDIGIPIMMNFVMVFGYAVVSPLILPFGLIYFVLLWPIWRYQMLYVYLRQYESGGQFWPYVAHKLVWCQMLMVVFTALVFLVKGAYTQAGVLAVTLPILLLNFKSYLSSRYDAVVKQVPLMAVHSAARGQVDPDVYTAPPLRMEAQGWHPEWGKCWQWWGIPRYTL